MKNAVEFLNYQNFFEQKNSIESLASVSLE
jgi:hypothetical protein